MNEGLFGEQYGAPDQFVRRRVKIGQGASQVVFDALVMGTTDNTSPTSKSNGAVVGADVTDFVILLPASVGIVGQNVTAIGGVSVQVPDGTIAGGNRRGAGSWDFQTLRSAASKVVSGLRGLAQGRGNTVSGNDGFASGDDNTVSGSSSMASGGSNNVSGSQAGAIGASLTVGGTWGFSCGNGNSSNGAYAFSSGTNCTATNTGGQAHGNNATNRGVDFKFAYASGARSAQGDAQNGRMIIRATSTGATPGIATSNGSAAGTTNTDVLPNNSSFAFFGTAIARNTANNDSAMFTFKGLISRDASAAATAFVGTPTVTQDYADAGMTTAALAMTVNTTRGSLEIQYTGIAATTIAWVIKYETVENA